MRRLALHIGHAKTGSSYLQSTLALSQQALAEAGIAYPSSVNFERAKDGMMTTGNSEALLRAIDEADPALFNPPPDAAEVLYSAEHLTPALAKPGAIEQLRKVADVHGFTEVDIFLVIRDPLEHMLSEYGQKIKGGRGAILARFAKRHEFPEFVNRILEATTHVPGMTLTVVNYRRVKNDLIGAFAAWLGAPRTCFTPPERTIVNRALTADELAFQARLNDRFGRSPGLIAEPLMRGLPNQPQRPPVLGRVSTRAFFARLSPAIRAVNRHLPRSDRYHTGGPLRLWTPRRVLASLRPDEVRLSHEQVRVIVDGFADEIEALRATQK
jgi:hypothetical protein